MATKARFSTHQFCKAWQEHGPKSSTWDEFVGKMREEAGNPKYSEDEIERRLGVYSKQLKGKVRAPKYPKPRTPSALAFFQKE